MAEPLEALEFIARNLRLNHEGLARCRGLADVVSLDATIAGIRFPHGQRAELRGASATAARARRRRFSGAGARPQPRVQVSSDGPRRLLLLSVMVRQLTLNTLDQTCRTCKKCTSSFAD